MLLLKMVRGLFALCHWLFIGSEQVLPPKHKITGTNQWFTSILSHQINQNVIFWETRKRIQFLKNTCPWSDDFSSYKVISVSTEVGALSSSWSQQISPCPQVQDLSEVLPSRLQSLFTLPTTHCHETSGDPPSLRLLPFYAIWISI